MHVIISGLRAIGSGEEGFKCFNKMFISGVDNGSRISSMKTLYVLWLHVALLQSSTFQCLDELCHHLQLVDWRIEPRYISGFVVMWAWVRWTWRGRGRICRIWRLEVARCRIKSLVVLAHVHPIRIDSAKDAVDNVRSEPFPVHPIQRVAVCCFVKERDVLAVLVSMCWGQVDCSGIDDLPELRCVQLDCRDYDRLVEKDVVLSRTWTSRGFFFYLTSSNLLKSDRSYYKFVIMEYNRYKGM